MAMFQYWNFNRFQNPFPVYRDNIMQLSKVGSKNTYHKCIKELHEAKYIYYHPSLSRFLPVKISMARLDIPEEPPSRYKQLDLFGTSENGFQNSKTDLSTEKNPQENGHNLAADKCPKIETDSVPNLTVTCPNFDTEPVPKMGHNIKHKHSYKRESKPLSQKIFDKNEKINQEINNLGRVPNLVHHPSDITEVEGFFSQHDYPATEAKKFFNHYKAIGWKIKGVTPIEDWQAAAHKWMLNAGKFEEKKQEPLQVSVSDIDSLYKQFLAGQNVFKEISLDHFKELKLELTEAILAHAWQQRINQLTGSNQYSILQLLQAYQDNRENDALLIKDKENFISLAKRIAVLNHFQQLKISGCHPEHSEGSHIS